MKSFKEYLTLPNGMSFREIINELTDVELEEKVQNYLQQQLKNCNKPPVMPSVCLHLLTYCDEDNFRRCQSCDEIVD